jgi:PPM family protein phosphatase
MQEAKNTQRSLVRLGYDGRVHKTFRGTNADERFANEVRVLKYLEARQCPFVPRVLADYPDRLELVTTNCGSRVEQISDEKLKSLFDELEKFGVQHDDPFMRNVTYRASDGRFCVIDFELSTILDKAWSDEPSTSPTSQPTSLDVNLIWSGMTDRGRFRENNEDTFLAAMLDERGVSYLGRTGSLPIQGKEFIFAVSDGMGGENSGEFASRIATQKIALQLPRHFGIHPRNAREYCQQVLQGLFESIHQDLLSLGRYDRSCVKMGATLTLVWIRRDQLHYAHIGDSRLYTLSKDQPLTQISEDHTHVGWLRRRGEINERQAREHPRRTVLSQCLGAGHRYLAPQCGSLPYSAGDTFLLLTDGVTDGLWDRGLEEMVLHPPSARQSQPIADRLVQTATEQSGRDNASAVAISVELGA